MAAQVEAQAPRKALLDTEKILVATRDAPAGTFLKPEDMEWLPWPEDGVVSAYIQEGELTVDDFKGAVVRTDLRAGQPFAESYVVYPGDRGFLAAVLEPGDRAVSVPVNATSGIAGFVFPGDRVDVLLTMKMQTQGSGEDQTRYLSETILKAIRVLAIDQASQNAEGKAELAKTATLEVTPKQAEAVAIALQMGSLSLSLNSLGHVGVARAGSDEDAVQGSVLNVSGNISAGADGTASLEQAEDSGSSYTLDYDILTARNDPRLHSGGGSAPSGGNSVNVVVLRADQTESVAF